MRLGSRSKWCTSVGFALSVVALLFLLQLYFQCKSQHIDQPLSLSSSQLSGRGMQFPLKAGHKDFPWGVDRPSEPPVVGWEDAWMTVWKRKRYDPMKEAACWVVEASESLYDDGFLCEIPAYIPPRVIAITPQKITRVIFQSFMYRKMSRSQYIHFSSWIALNPTYEFVLFDDDDVDDFICENNSVNISQPFSKLVAGAAKIDFWRVLVIEKYGGVYLDADLLALAPLPIYPQDNLVTGLGCWEVVHQGPSFEHWSMAFSPHHRLLKETLSFILVHLSDPQRNDTAELTTGPGPYQEALHVLLAEAKCKEDFCDYAHQPGFWSTFCDSAVFLRTFGSITIFSHLNFNQTYSNKLVLTAEFEQNPFEQKHYDEEPHKSYSLPDFCHQRTRNARKKEREENWERAREYRSNLRMENKESH